MANIFCSDVLTNLLRTCGILFSSDSSPLVAVLDVAGDAIISEF